MLWGTANCALAIAATVLLVVLWRSVGRFEEFGAHFQRSSSDTQSPFGTRIFSAETIDHNEAEINADAWNPLDRHFWTKIAFLMRASLLFGYLAVMFGLML